MLDAIEQATGRLPDELSADAGYCSEDNLKALEERNVRGYVATGRQRHGTKSATGTGPVRSGSRRAAMRCRLRRGGDGSLYLKADFGEDGQIDFIAAPPVTDHEPLKRTIQGRELLLEAVPGIIASKIHYRGSHLKVRDIFDIAAGCEAGHHEAIRETLAAMPGEAAVALQRLRQHPAGRLAELMPGRMSGRALNTCWTKPLQLQPRVLALQPEL